MSRRCRAAQPWSAEAVPGRGSSIDAGSLLVQKQKLVRNLGLVVVDTSAGEALGLHVPVVEELHLPALTRHSHSDHDGLVTNDVERVAHVPGVKVLAKARGTFTRCMSRTASSLVHLADVRSLGRLYGCSTTHHLPIDNRDGALGGSEVEDEAECRVDLPKFVEAEVSHLVAETGGV
ncbi:MAG: hypothetical protein QOE76_3717, partial [Frankiales bacterium]|nr:hypothetical protein [Frankiales bacterium]